MDKHKSTLPIEDIQVGQVWTHMVFLPEAYGKKHHYTIILITDEVGDSSYTLLCVEGTKTEGEESLDTKCSLCEYPKKDLRNFFTIGNYKQNDLEFLVWLSY